MKIIDYLNSKKINSNAIYALDEKGYHHLDVFFEVLKNPFEALVLISYKEAFLSYMTSLNPKDFDQISEFVNRYSSLFTHEKLPIILGFLLMHSASEILQNGEVDFDKLKEYSSSVLNYVKKGANYLEVYLFHKDELNEFASLFDKYGLKNNNLWELADILLAIDKLKVDTIGKKIIDEFIFRKNINNVINSCKCIERQYYASRSKYSQKLKEINRYNVAIQKIIDRILKNPVYINADVMEQLLSLCPDDEIKHTLLDYIYELNSRRDSAIQKQNDNFLISSKRALKPILSEFGININEVSKDDTLLLCNMYSLDLKQKLNFFAKFAIPIPNVSVLPLFSLDTIQEVTSLLLKGILTPDFIAQNLYLLEKDNESYKIVIQNLELLAEADINIRNYPNSLDILLKDLHDNIAILSLYGISIKSKTQDISFIASENLQEKLDLLIENGQDITTMESYDILNKSLPELYMMVLSTNLGFSYEPDFYRTFNSEDLMPNTQSLIPLEYFQIFAKAKHKVNLPPFLEKYVINPYTLNINGVYVSLNRLCLIIEGLMPDDIEGIFYALVYKSYYNLNDVMLLKEELANIKLSR